jgi:hypothetical protein
MAENEATWTADWPMRVKRRLREQGFETIKDFLKKHPAVPYVDVVNKIASWVAAMQLSRLQMEEAKEQGKLREAAMDSLARNLNALPNGWVVDSATESQAARAVARTSALIAVDGNSPQYDDQMLIVYNALKELNPSIGWRPSGPDDPLIQKAFGRGWPE